MTLPGQPHASPALQQALDLLAAGKPDEADDVLTNAAKQAKAQHGSGSHPLACAYADMARLHFHAGDYKRSAAEFKHASSGPMPLDLPSRGDRLAFMFGYAACLDALDMPADAEKVLRQCVAFARNLHGPASSAYANSLEPLAEHLLKTGKAAEAARLSDEAFDILWKHGDPAIAAVIPARAVAWKAAGRKDDPFADLRDLPDEMIAEAVARVIARAGQGDGAQMRQVLADLLRFLDRRFGDGHPALADTLAAIAQHEAALGERGDAKVRSTAARRAVWSFAKTRAPAGLLASLEVAFESGGTIHLVPHLARQPNDAEAVRLEMVLTQAVDDLYARAKTKGAV